MGQCIRMCVVDESALSVVDVEDIKWEHQL